MFQQIFLKTVRYFITKLAGRPSLVFASKEKSSVRLSGEHFTSTLCVSRSWEFLFLLSRVNQLNVVFLCVYIL